MITKEFLNVFNQSITVEGQSLINEFFVIFSRFEFALKGSGFAHDLNGKVIVNWNAFVKSIGPAFETSEKTQDLVDAIDYLTNHPPKVQNLANGHLGWSERSFEVNIPLINKLSQSIRDIRNNLFHGGKFNGNFQEDVSRNAILLKSAIEILNHWLQHSQAVKQKFLEPIG